MILPRVSGQNIASSSGKSAGLQTRRMGVRGPRVMPYDGMGQEARPGKGCLIPLCGHMTTEW